MPTWPLWANAGKAAGQKIKYNGINPITNLDSDPKAFLGISLIKMPAWKKLRPKIFSTVTPKKYSPSVKRKTPVCYKYIQKGKEIGEQKFHPDFRAKTLEIETSKKSGIDLANMVYPKGTIGIASKLDETISTSNMWQCAAASFVDKKGNTQALVHFCPTIHKHDNEDFIKYILKNMPEENVEISIAPGIYPETDNTISFLVDTIKKYNKKAKIEFCNFPKGYERVVLENGKLKCIEDKLFTTTKRNPLDRIFFASTFI